MRDTRSKRERGIETRRRNDPRARSSSRPARLRFLLALTAIGVAVGRNTRLVRALTPARRKGAGLPR